jgi:hypothetical protein
VADHTLRRRRRAPGSGVRDLKVESQALCGVGLCVGWPRCGTGKAECHSAAGCHPAPQKALCPCVQVCSDVCRFALESGWPPLSCRAPLVLALRKNQARLRYAIWFIASIKFLIPFSLLVGLGMLKLEPAKGMAEFVVIDHVERPSEN